MSRLAGWLSCLLVAWLPDGISHAAQVQLAPGNGIWLKPASTPVAGNETVLISALKARSIRHVFLWTTTYTSASYATFIPFIEQGHSQGMTFHALCATKAMVTSGGTLSPTLLSNALNEVFAYNASHPEASFDGVQIDVEGVTGPALLGLVSGVHVPETLVFSAAVQPNEFYTGVESSYASLIEDTDLDMLVPMIYTMDGIGYAGGATGFTFNLARIRSKTASILALLPANGRMMTGLSAYDREYPVSKSTGAIDWDFLNAIGATDGLSQPAFSTVAGSKYSVPNLVAAGYPLMGVSYLTNTGVSVYRFDRATNTWLDVLEMSPIGLRRSIAAADQAGTNDARYVGTCTWLYQTTFDPYIGRQEGLTPDDGVYPCPVVALEVLALEAGQARLRLSLTNACPSEQVLGAHRAAGVHLRAEGDASFVSATRGQFHAVDALDASGNPLPAIDGARSIELRRCFFENSASPGAQSGEIVIRSSSSFTLRYRGWMMNKDSLCNDIGTSEPYVARTPEDVHYDAASSSLATFATNLLVPQPTSFATTVLGDRPVTYHRFSETDVVTLPNPFTAENLGTVGAAGNGTALATNSGVGASIVGGRPGALASATNTAFGFPGNSDTNRITVPYRTEWNVNGPFTIELWLKGGTNFSCPAASAEFDTRGWLVYQGDAAQTTGDGWYFRVYKTGSSRVTAQANMTVDPNAWCHVVGVYDGAQALLYVNGSLASSAALGGAYTPNTNAAYPLTFGARCSANPWAYGGLMDEAAFYTNALSASEIATHFAAATTDAAHYAAHVLAHRPAGYWRFDDPLNPPRAGNSGSLGPSRDGAYLYSSATVPASQEAAWAGLEATNRVLQLTGARGQVIIPPLNLNTNTVTFECLLQRQGTQENGAGLILHRNADGSGACGLGLRGPSSHLGYLWNDAANTYTWDSGLTPPDGQWCYVALTVAPTQAVICLCDGTTWRTATRTLSHAVQPFGGLTRIGADDGTNYWFHGLIDEAAIYSATLSPTQLRTHALAALGSLNRPLFTQVPASQTVNFGATAVLAAAAIGSPAPVCQWRKDGAVLSGATNFVLSIPNADYTNAGQYRLLAANDCGSVLSPTAALVVWPPPSVTHLTYRLSDTPAGRRLELIWPAGTLHSAGEMTGPWEIVSGTAPPYHEMLLDTVVAGKFFRTQ